MTPWYQQFRAEQVQEQFRPQPWGESDARRVRPAARPWQAEWQPGDPRIVVQPPAAPRVVVQAVAQDPERGPRTQIAALRGTAADLEATANRLEEVELYQQADALRALAQRLRGDARQRLARGRGEAGPSRRAPSTNGPNPPQYVDPPSGPVPTDPTGPIPQDRPTPALLSDPPRAAMQWSPPQPIVAPPLPQPRFDLIGGEEFGGPAAESDEGG
jgi:hypothetical protein